MNNAIQNHFPMCPRRLFELKENRKLIAKELKIFDRPGVYILYEGRVPYYIGKANRLWTRLHDHANKSTDEYFHHWDYFQAFVIPDPGHRSEIEGILCLSFPTANRSKKKFEKERIPSQLRAKIRDATRRVYQD